MDKKLTNFNLKNYNEDCIEGTDCFKHYEDDTSTRSIRYLLIIS